MSGVDQTGMPWIRFLDVGTRILEISFECDRNKREIFVFEFVVNLLPDRQIIATASPGSPDQEEDFVPLEVRQ